MALPSHAQQSETVEQTTGAPHALHTSPVPLNAPLPPFDITADQETAAPGLLESNAGAGQPATSAPTFSVSGHVVIVGGREFELRADSLSYNDVTGVAIASGHVLLHEIDTTFTASRLTYNRTPGLGMLDNAMLDYPPFMIASREIELYSDHIVANDATVSTCPPGRRQEYHVVAQQIRLDMVKRRLYARNATLYIGGTRIFTVKRYSRKLLTGPTSTNTNQGLRPSFGYDSHRGPYLVLGDNIANERFPLNLAVLIPTKRDFSASASTSTTILLSHNHAEQDELDRETNTRSMVSVVRSFSSYPGRALPDGDPLLFHDFLGNDPLESVFNRPVVADLVPNATLSYHEPLYGRRISDLSYSRNPEVAIRVDLPLSGNGDLPLTRDPVAMRQALRRPYIFAYADFTAGYYQEQPTEAQSDRTAAAVKLDMRPLLIGPNTLIRPRVRIFEAQYVTARDHYGYQQINLAVQRSFSERTAIGAEYVGAVQHGRDPFIFDSLDTTQEFDLRGQTGLRRAILGARLRFDLRNHDLYDWQIDYSLPQRCYIPTIIYDNRSRSLGFGFNIQGLTF